ncbi:MAG: carbamoyl-phosphate synthase large subunit [Polaromonas sp. 39-63-25]|nr:MAG: carbamoyl-phosphate synthase large subunit [Polaromonas sp. 35-63-35]OYZ22846.1 MAG: carbamoyl-phosphate synthase large subunit [Polaromonas sp. 16-63-31]OYZ81465.1 MAG: carbamoyl-phosphate synthase large subunit [Polaromonas sp. 24-63-21]OZA53062.1 MAG: carbamoyl-phosphate synthase large subunit [Polaromonas sp. 17-63-33]OZA88826.1 MAG: carbamoyl-phosphate synthase large subunit [Polaromonas sp. 39-63-25]
MSRLLIANRGEIARRIMRTAHRMGMATVAVYSDVDAQALHVQEAGSAVALGGTLSADSYLRIDKLLAAAKAAGADAVHPGYGFLSENAEFAQAVLDAGLTWVGPPPAAIRALGNKSSAKNLALQQNVPCLSGYQGPDQSDTCLTAEADKLGYPLMVKAAAGGGGRGMRLVLEPSLLQAALHSARSEALSSFGSDELLLERALLRPRHVEVQVFADAHGHCIHLGERDCSVQRRHQKLIEESPSPAVNAELRERMGACAVALAQAAGYVGAGTVEFLLDENGDFFLMEMNTRLQVEHPVTEAVTGLDLVEWQLRIAQGEVLPLCQDDVVFRGHAIEVRLCAEDDDFSPHAGRVQHFSEPAHARFDHALQAGGEVTPFYDSMLGKLIVHGATRAQAMDGQVAALAGTQVLGLPTNRAFLAACLAHPVFRAGQALIPFLAEHGDGIRQTLQDQQTQVLLPAVLGLHFQGGAGAAQSLPCPFGQALRVLHGEQVLAITVTETGAGWLEVSSGAHRHTAACVRGSDGRMRVTVDGLSRTVQACRVAGGRWHVQVGAVDVWLKDASFEPAAGVASSSQAMELRAPFNGKVIAVKVSAGESVKRGDTLLVIESMKLEHAVCATRDAVVAAMAVEPGQQTAPGQVLLRFEA